MIYHIPTVSIIQEHCVIYSHTITPLKADRPPKFGGVIELEKLLTYYGHDRYQEGSNFPSSVDVMACKREFLAFKLQATTEWGDKTCKDLWGTII